MFKQVGEGKKLLILADNLSAHKVAEVKALLGKSNHKIVFNLPYASYLNPIEYYFGSLKRNMRDTDYKNY